jgi:hypothetical protein
MEGGTHKEAEVVRVRSYPCGLAELYRCCCVVLCIPVLLCRVLHNKRLASLASLSPSLPSVLLVLQTVNVKAVLPLCCACLYLE